MARVSVDPMILETLRTKPARADHQRPTVSAKTPMKPRQPETLEISGRISQPRDRGPNPRTGTILRPPGFGSAASSRSTDRQ